MDNLLNIAQRSHYLGGPCVYNVIPRRYSLPILSAPSTLSLGNSFFLDAGLLHRADAGKFLPSEAVREFAHAHQWGAATASRKLAPVLQRTWFFAAIEPRLKFTPSIGEDVGLQVLSEQCQATPEYRPQLRTLLMYLEAGGLIARDGSNIRLLGQTQVVEELAPEPTGEPEPAPVSQSRPAVGVSSGFAGTPEGRVRFNVSVEIDMVELASWRADRISALFVGMAQVLAAKADVEVGATNQ